MKKFTIAFIGVFIAISSIWIGSYVVYTCLADCWYGFPTAITTALLIFAGLIMTVVGFVPEEDGGY